MNLLGRLKYRLSYGQNVLNHLVETAKVAGMLAAEVGVTAGSGPRAAFLHDIGKAVSHELAGSPPWSAPNRPSLWGGPGGGARHRSPPQRGRAATLTAVIVQASDGVSAARPGARREAVELSYVHRLERIEEIAGGFKGVERVFAMQAGREVRVVVDPGEIDDLGPSNLARRISRRLEEACSTRPDPGDRHPRTARRRLRPMTLHVAAPVRTPGRVPAGWGGGTWCALSAAR